MTRRVPCPPTPGPLLGRGLARRCHIDLLQEVTRQNRRTGKTQRVSNTRLANDGMLAGIIWALITGLSLTAFVLAATLNSG